MLMNNQFNSLKFQIPTSLFIAQQMRYNNSISRDSNENEFQTLPASELQLPEIIRKSFPHAHNKML